MSYFQKKRRKFLLRCLTGFWICLCDRVTAKEFFKYFCRTISFCYKRGMILKQYRHSFVSKYTRQSIKISPYQNISLFIENKNPEENLAIKLQHTF